MDPDVLGDCAFELLAAVFWQAARDAAYVPKNIRNRDAVQMEAREFLEWAADEVDCVALAKPPTTHYAPHRATATLCWI